MKLAKDQEQARAFDLDKRLKVTLLLLFTLQHPSLTLIIEYNWSAFTDMLI